jgi:hypothetical protein
MTDLPLSRRPDGDLETALRGLAAAIDWPSAGGEPGGQDLAAAVRAQIEATPATGGPAVPVIERRRGSRWTWRPARRALVLALLALLVLAAIAGAIGFGLPGLRIILGGAAIGPSGSPPVSAPPSIDPSQSPAPGPPGAAMRLGERIELADLDERAGFRVEWPDDPSIGPPDAAYIEDQKGGIVSLVWAATPALPATREPGVGLVLSQFRGDVDEGFFTKALNGETSIDLVLVGNDRGFWLSGDPHMFFWEGPAGPVHEERRWVGDALVWSNGVITFRLETSLGRDEALRLALALR